MSQELYSVEQVAERLGLHARTVRNYVRDGRLKAVRIGKQYRIAREELEALTGRSASAFGHDPRQRHRYVEVSSIVQIDAISPDAASRVTSVLLGAAKVHDEEQDGPLRVETIYGEECARMKIILVGGLDSNADMFRLITASLET